MAAGDHAALATVNVTGDQDVTLVTVASEIAGALTVNDTGSGTFTLDVGTTAGAVDTSGGSIIDQLNINVNMAANALTVATGQNVTFTIDQATASNLVVGSAAAAASNAVTVTLNDEAANTAAVDVANLTVTQAKSVTVNAGVDVNTDGTKSNLTSLEASASNADITINTGANGVTLTTGITAGAAGAYGDAIFTGSGAISQGAIAANVDTFNASAMTGAVTMTGVITGNVNTITTGTANDTVMLGALTTTSVNTGAGNDSVQLFNDYGTKTVTLTGGDGTDTLVFVTGTKLSDLTASSAVTGFENIQLFESSTTQEIDAGLLNDATYNVTASATGATGTATVVIGSADTDISLLSLVESTNVSNTVAAMTFIADASANSAAIAYTGADAAKNNITGSASGGDTLTGGAKVDNFNVTSDGLLFNTSNVMLDTYVGGAGTDVYTVGTVDTAFTITGADAWSKSSGVETVKFVGDNDQIISIVLDVTAQTAGIATVDLSLDTDATSANVLSAAEYTTLATTLTGSAGADTITGGAGADAITGGAAADTLAGGDGNDTFSYGAIADLFASNALVDTSVAGGNGTDIISGGVTGTAYTVANTMVFTGITGVETFAANANTAAVSVSLDGTAFVSGIRTVDISAGTSATSNVIDASEYTGAYSAALTLTGSATGATAITGGAGIDTITGGTGIDTVQGGAGADVIDLRVDVVSDIVILDNEATVDVINNFQAGTGGDVIHLDVSTLNGGNIAASEGTVITTEAAGFIDYTVGVASAANAATSNIIHVTNTTGINSIADVNTALGNDNIVMDAGGTAFANAEASVIVFYDADDAKMTVGYLEDSAAATAGVFDGTGSTFVELASVSMSTTDYGLLAATNFDFI